MRGLGLGKDGHTDRWGRECASRRTDRRTDEWPDTNQQVVALGVAGDIAVVASHRPCDVCGLLQRHTHTHTCNVFATEVVNKIA